MTEFVTSPDGTRIVFTRIGSGPPVVLVAAAGQFRAFDGATVELARQLADRGFTVVNYDRRGRGESTDTQPGGLDREIEDLSTIVDAVGGTAALYGSSSGAVLALWAAQAGLDITKIALWEAPLRLDDDGTESLNGIRERVERGDRDDAVAFFMRDMPPQWLASARASDSWPVMLSIAPTLAYDMEALARAQSGEDWAVQWNDVTMPVLVMFGEETLPIFPTAAKALVTALPNARQLKIAASNHGWRPEVMVAVLAEFFSQPA